VNRRKPRVQTLVVRHYPAPAPVDDFIFLFLPPCGLHLTLLATGSLESGLLVSPLLGGPARHRPFAPTLHLYQCKSSRNLHLQYSAKSQSTPRCQSLITARSDHPPVLGRSGPQRARFLKGHEGHGGEPDACAVRRTAAGRRHGRGPSAGGAGRDTPRCGPLGLGLRVASGRAASGARPSEPGRRGRLGRHAARAGARSGAQTCWRGVTSPARLPLNHISPKF
jgi:hypothetical protein